MKRRCARVGMSVVALIGHAHAAEPPSPKAVFEYASVEGCPGEFTFRAQVQARTAKLEVLPPSDKRATSAPLGLVVKLSRDDAGYAGVLETWRYGASTSSQLAAPTCDEVVAGLALAAALAAEADEAAPAPTAEVVPAKAPPAPAPSPTSSPDREVLVYRSHWLFGAELGVRSGYGPGPRPSFGLLFGRAPVNRRRLAWRLSVDGVFGQDARDASRKPPTTLQLSWFGARADVCPLTLSLGLDGALLACPSVEAGVLHASASSGESSSRAWLAPGLALHVTATFGRGRFFIDGQAGAHAVVTRDRYWFRPDSEAYRTPWVTASLGFAGGIAF
jgi:hypothetical protein